MLVLNEILADSVFLGLLLSSRVHLDMLMAFFKSLTQRSSILLADVQVVDRNPDRDSDETDDDDGDEEDGNDDDDDLHSNIHHRLRRRRQLALRAPRRSSKRAALETHKRLCDRLAIALHAFYCRLTHADKDAFSLALLEAHDTEQSRGQLLTHLTEFAALPLFSGRKETSPTSRRAFTSFISRIRLLSNKSPVSVPEPDPLVTSDAAPDAGSTAVAASSTAAAVAFANGPKLTRVRSSTQKRKLSDLDHFLMQTSYRLTARNVDEVPDLLVAGAGVPAPLQTLSEKFLAGIQTVTVSRRDATGPWTLHAARTVSRGEFLVEYTGQRIDQDMLASADAETRTRIQSSGPNCLIRLHGNQLLDSSRVGSMARSVPMFIMCA